jgi:hypothetical protein
MAYHVGLILHEVFGFECFALDIDIGMPDRDLFEYPRRFSRLPWEAGGAMATPDDLLVVNPSFSSLLLGLSFPGRKLSYVQGFTTFDVLDGFLDHYVAVSGFVRDFLARTYGLDPPVIPAFVHTERVPEPPPWEERPPGRVLVLRKSHSAAFLKYLTPLLAARRPGLRVEFDPVTGLLSQRELLEKMQGYRYVLSLSACEGFGLGPLEAMLCGCAVVGFHALGGKDYMEPGRNCEAVGYPEFAQLADALARILSDDAYAHSLAAEGRRTALRLGIEPFRERWGEFFARTMKLPR